MSEGNNIAIQNLSYVREVDNKNKLSGELDNLFNLTQSTSPQSSPSKERRNKRIILARKGIIMIICFLSLLFSFSAHATCTPTPDCASIGYNKTSCETISLKCPFDQTKLYCFPCDSSYQYTCSNTNEYGNGESCNNKYKSCCNTDCIVGAIYYSDGTCNSCLDNNKTPIGVVVKDNELIISQIRSTSMEWGTYENDIDTLSNITTEEDAKADHNGKYNTTILVEFQTTEGKTSSNSPAINCNEYFTESTNAGDWYLPALGELYTYVSANYSKISQTMEKLSWKYGSRYFWSSSEESARLAWGANSFNEYIDGSDKDGKFSVTCFLAINKP